MSDLTDTTTDILNIASLLATLLPAAVSLYDKIEKNNQGAGLVPAATLLADVISVSTTVEKTAEDQINAASSS